MKGFKGKISDGEVWRFLVPLFISTVFRNGYTMVNAAVSGRFLSPGALAVIVASGSCLSMENYLYVSMTTGFGFFINRCIGSGDTKQQRESLWGSLWLCLCMIILGIFLSGLADMVMTLANIPDLSMMSVVVQTGLMVSLIVRGGLGAEASALAVLINHIWVALLFIWIFRQPVGRKLLTSPCLPKGEVWSELLKNGCSKSFMMILIGLGAFSFRRRINALPEEILIGYSYGQVPVDFLMSSLGAFAVTAGLITGQNRGNDRIWEADCWNRKLLAASIVLCAVYIVSVLAFAPTIIGSLSGTELTEAAICLIFVWVLMPQYGYAAVCWSAAVRWGIPAVTAVLIYRKYLRNEIAE